jgi:hypothetical protein
VGVSISISEVIDSLDCITICCDNAASTIRLIISHDTLEQTIMRYIIAANINVTPKDILEEKEVEIYNMGSE